MAIAFVGADGASVAPAAATITLPAHTTGDVILIWAWNPNSTTLPTLPAGYTSIFTVSASVRGGRLGYKIAASSGETSGNWVNARQLEVVIYRNVASLGTPTSGSASSTTVAYPSLTLGVTDGSSWVVCFGGHRAATNVGTAPASLTNRAAVTATGSTAAHDTNAGVSSWAGDSSSVDATGVWSAVSLELVASGSGTSVALTGRSATVSRGSLAASAQGAGTGRSATVSKGTFGVSASIRLTGRSATASKGVLSVPGGAVTLGLVGRALQTFLGVLTPSSAMATPFARGNSQRAGGRGGSRTDGQGGGRAYANPGSRASSR